MNRLLSGFIAALLTVAGTSAPVHARASRIDRAAQQIAAAVLKAKIPKGVSIAVLPFENSRKEATELGRLIADGVTNELVNSGKVTALDRAYLSRMLSEIKMNQMGITNQGAALQIGKFSGASYMLVGNFEPYGKRKLLLQIKLLETEKAVVHAATRVTIKLDKHMRALHAKKAVLDTVAGAMAIEVSDKGDVFFLQQNGPGGCRWLESHAEAGIGKAGKQAARAAALTLARDRAMRKVLGRGTGTVDFTDSAIKKETESVLRAIRSGRVEVEKILSEKASGGQYIVALQTCLKAAGKSVDKEFNVQLMLNQGRFTPGQEARAILTSSREAHVYIFSVDFDLNVYKVFPVAAAPDNKVVPGKPFQFPNEEHRSLGIRLIAELPKGKKTSVETLRVVAVKRNVGTLLDGAGTYSEIVRRLEDSGDEWTEDVRVFAIHKR